MNLFYYIRRFNRDLQELSAIISINGYASDISTIHLAIIALEDRRFCTHRGYDIFSILRELLKFATFQRFGGASTIEMQLVRTVTNLRKIRLSRKLYEIILSRYISRRFSKSQILLTYSRVAYFGHKSHGLDSYLALHFGNWDEIGTDYNAALVASALRYPRPKHSNEKWIIAVERRARYGVAIMTKIRANLTPPHPHLPAPHPHLPRPPHSP